MTERKTIFGTPLANLDGCYKEGMIELITEYADDNPESITFPEEAIPNLIEFLEECQAKRKRR